MGLPDVETLGRVRRTDTYCLLARVSEPSVGWAIDNEFPRPSDPGLFRKEVITMITDYSCLNRNPRCESNLGDVDKYRYSVALVEFWFRTDAVLHPWLV